MQCCLSQAIAGALFMALTSMWFADSIETLADSAAIGLWIYHQWQPDDDFGRGVL